MALKKNEAFCVVIIYLWCGPFGARIGIAIPTNPHSVVINNTANAPMVQYFRTQRTPNTLKFWDKIRNI